MASKPVSLMVTVLSAPRSMPRICRWYALPSLMVPARTSSLLPLALLMRLANSERVVPPGTSMVYVLSP